MALLVHCADSHLQGVSCVLEAKIVLWQVEKQGKKPSGSGFFRSIEHLQFQFTYVQLENQAEIYNVRLAVINTPCEFLIFEISSLNEFHNIPLGDIRIQSELSSIGNNFFLFGSETIILGACVIYSFRFVFLATFFPIPSSIKEKKNILLVILTSLRIFSWVLMLELQSWLPFPEALIYMDNRFCSSVQPKAVNYHLVFLRMENFPMMYNTSLMI